MDEASWLACNDPQKMIAYLRGSPLDNGANIPPAILNRKLRLFVEAAQCTFCISFVEGMTPEDAAEYVAGASCGSKAEKAALLRCLFGNLWRPVPREAWDSYCPSLGLLALIRAIYDERRWEDMPILADALEEAGCDTKVRCPVCKGYGWTDDPPVTTDNPCEACGMSGYIPNPLLAHLRSGGPHARGCWALDCLLGKE